MWRSEELHGKPFVKVPVKKYSLVAERLEKEEEARKAAELAAAKQRRREGERAALQREIRAATKAAASSHRGEGSGGDDDDDDVEDEPEDKQAMEEEDGLDPHDPLRPLRMRAVDMKSLLHSSTAETQAFLGRLDKAVGVSGREEGGPYALQREQYARAARGFGTTGGSGSTDERILMPLVTGMDELLSGAGSDTESAMRVKSITRTQSSCLLSSRAQWALLAVVIVCIVVPAYVAYQYVEGRRHH